MPLDLRKKVAVVGVGCTRFGELYDRSAEDLLCEAVDEALADAGCERERIEAAWVGTVMSTFGGDALADALKLFGRPMTRVQNYCASGMDAFRNACLAVAAGVHDVVLAVGFEKMRDGGFARPNRSHPVLDFGERAPHVFALSANRYFARYGLNPERLALARPDAIVMHPQPMNRGIEIASDVADGPHSVIRDQVRNGVAVRMAVLAEVIGTRS